MGVFEDDQARPREAGFRYEQRHHWRSEGSVALRCLARFSFHLES